MLSTATQTTDNSSAMRITIIGTIVDFVLAIFKLVVGFLSNSYAMIADGLHSFSDLLSDGITLFATKHSSAAPDKKHPYGHKRFETLATLVLSILLLLVGVWILFEAIAGFFTQKIITHYYLLIAVATVSILSKELLFWATIVVANKQKSQLLKANAWHHRTDSLSSVAVLIGIIASFYDINYADSIAAIIVAGMIIYISYKIGVPAIKELVDTSIDEENIHTLKTEIRKISGVVDVHMLRARSYAGNIFLDTHVQVEPKLSVSEGHVISLVVEDVAKKCCDSVVDIMVHIDPEDDETFALNARPMEREQIIDIINAKLTHIPWEQEIIDIRLHYLNSKISVDFFLTLKSLEISDKQTIHNNLRDALKEYDYFSEISVYFQ